MRACVDVGGTKVAVSLSRDSASPLLGRRSEPTATHGAHDALARQILRLIDEVWDVNWFGSTKTLDVHVAALRKKLDPALIHCLTGAPHPF